MRYILLTIVLSLAAPAYAQQAQPTRTLGGKLLHGLGKTIGMLPRLAGGAVAGAAGTMQQQNYAQQNYSNQVYAQQPTGLPGYDANGFPTAELRAQRQMQSEQAQQTETLNNMARDIHQIRYGQ